MLGASDPRQLLGVMHKIHAQCMQTQIDPKHALMTSRVRATAEIVHQY